jgi:hypothetical protein
MSEPIPVFAKTALAFESLFRLGNGVPADA